MTIDILVKDEDGQVVQGIRLLTFGQLERFIEGMQEVTEDLAHYFEDA